ncbi:hypothetical protein P6144_01660 [Sphingomonas sp. HITSZ_GF]|uniref:hypothetical protein n=1 Tax=Sphingomonas sp. HITSZ_GF TaxID=3037247 RepID=UPI00240D4916|nr:hypothetical protein [Sphingomonas sp. HITSZ_GF]MDG2532339.1 hypothetical protein [Sphingomonas sp. HITSZ_GF]
MKRLIILAGVATGVVAPAQAQRVQVTPYIEASQVVAADLNGGDVLTYSTVGAGIDAAVHSRRVEVQVSYRYEHRFDYQNRLNNDHTHSGLATVKAAVAPGFTIEAGGIATRTRSDIRGDLQTSNVGNFSNSAQVFSGYVGPNLATHLGPMFVNGAYRFGYTKVEAPGTTGVAAGQPRLDYYDDSTVHVATASVGVKSGTVLPVGITASGSYTRENAGQLDQRFEGKWGRGDVVLPVLRGLALAGGVGYEQIKITQRDALLDTGGQPVLDGAGRFRTDPNSPRRIAYNLEGVFWDAGVIWKPSRRTFFEARVGRRYGSMSYTGSLSYQAGPGSGIQIGVYDTVQTFGQQLNGQLSTLPTSLASTTDPFGNQFSGCVYGTTGAATGGCMTGILASATTSAYRGRGVTGVAVAGRGGTRIGIGGGWAKRDFIAPAGGSGFTTNGTSDTTIYGQIFASTNVGPNGSLQGSVIGSYYDSDLAGSDGIYGWGANAAYTHRFGRLGATLSTGIFGFERDGESSASAQALLGLRYGF